MTRCWNNFKISFIGFLFLSTLSCSTDIANCECEKMEIYYVSPSALTWGETSEKQLRKMGIVEVIVDSVRIEEFYKIFNKLNSSEKYKSIQDNRILIDLYCKGGGNSTVTANSSAVKNNRIIYNCTDEFLEYFEETKLKWFNDLNNKNER